MKKTKHPSIYYRELQNGQKIYYVRIRTRGRATWRAAGPSLGQARELQALTKYGYLNPSRKRAVLFSDLADRYFRDYAAQTQDRQNNWPRVRSILGKLNSFFGRTAIDQIGPKEADAYATERQETGVSPRTVNTELTYLRAILGKAATWGELAEIPRIAKRRTDETPRARVLSPAEIEEIRANVSPDHADAILIALYTGMRLNEIFSLSPKAVDYKAGIIHLEKTKSRKDRDIPIAKPELATTLKRRFLKCRGHLFTEATVGYLSQRFHLERKRIGGAPWRFHDLRHTCASWLLENGVDVVTVKEIMGHSSLAMTTRYLHTDIDRKRDALMKIDFRKA